MLSLLYLPILSSFNYQDETACSEVVFSRDFTDDSLRVILPIYVRLQAQQKSNITLWEGVPQDFTDHVATIDSKVLAMFISSNFLSFNLSNDNVGNLWLAANCSLNPEDYISTLMWVSSETISENLTSIGSVSLPEDYPEDVKTFLDSGRKLPVKNQRIQAIAADFNQTTNMTQTVESILDFVSKQGYDREKTRLLMSGNLNTTDILDFFNGALEVLEINSSICVERSWFATTILRAAGVPTRTVTDVRLKTWIQVWLPNIGWVDGETMCVEPLLNVSMLPKSISTHVPWMIENSSHAIFPFTWLPKVPMKVANLTFGNVELFNPNEYGTVLSQPVDAGLFRKDPAKFSFPLVFKQEIVHAAVTREGQNLTFSLFKGNENASMTLALGVSNSIALGDIAVSFKPIRHGNFLILQDFAVLEILQFDVRILVPAVGLPLVIAVVWLYWKRRKSGHNRSVKFIFLLQRSKVEHLCRES